MGKKLIRGRRNRVDIEFEIKFYEEILKKAPNFIEALIVLGDLYTKTSRYKEGLEIDKRLLKLRPDDPTVLYNLACSFSLMKHIDESLTLLKAAVEFGYDDFEYMQYDEDLTNLREDSRFKGFLSNVINRRHSHSSASNVHGQTI